MWRTSLGDRVLRGPEWDLFREALAGIWDLLDPPFAERDLFESGIPSFDHLPPGQKLAALALVGRELRDRAPPTPEHTAHNEAAVAAVFEFVRQCVAVEIGTEGEAGTFWRGLVLAAYRGTGARRGEPLPAAACDDPEEWEPLIRELSDRILWGDDYAVGVEVLYAQPDLTAEGLERVRRMLRQLTGRGAGPR